LPKSSSTCHISSSKICYDVGMASTDDSKPATGDKDDKSIIEQGKELVGKGTEEVKKLTPGHFIGGGAGLVLTWLIGSAFIGSGSWLGFLVIALLSIGVGWASAEGFKNTINDALKWKQSSLAPDTARAHAQSTTSPLVERTVETAELTPATTQKFGKVESTQLVALLGDEAAKTFGRAKELMQQQYASAQSIPAVRPSVSALSRSSELV
jgi:hypothetical protein